MDLQLTNKTALVTGASRGIGLSIVSALLSEGMRVVAAARTITPELKATGAVGVSVDLSEADAPARLIARAEAEFGGLDLLVNNVGGGDAGEGQTGGFLTFTDQQWYDAFELNFLASVRASRAALPHLTKSRGAIVNISSNGARTPHAGPVTYTTAKAALTAFGKALAEEFGPRGVRVNTVSPGPVRTDMWESPDGYGAELAKSLGLEQEQLLAGLPTAMGMVTGRLVKPEEVAALVAYLASPLAASTTGADHIIDGGAIKTV
ncbi:SDR family NAD(P)-dependent oxidoreductase [Streptomyces longisporoflavus]|uniref:SDR family NAD(P)-dependent oxidoreductase n=1 Tax=Streptomyces longisporoflavus TaxID=28044 RepID=A0ABW7R635_9ACTN|nr:SDR family oxidoreductase [Streptomyces longisporoflavus]GGV70954.1 3-oxoacyl-ACP reductase [Streptomyces longisporoflavus]